MAGSPWAGSGEFVRSAGIAGSVKTLEEAVWRAENHAFGRWDTWKQRRTQGGKARRLSRRCYLRRNPIKLGWRGDGEPTTPASRGQSWGGADRSVRPSAPQPGSPRSQTARFSVREAVAPARWKAPRSSTSALDVPRASQLHSALSGQARICDPRRPRQAQVPGKARGGAGTWNLLGEAGPRPERPPTSATTSPPGATYCGSGGSRRPGPTPPAPDTESRVPRIPRRAAAVAGSASSAA